MNAKSSNPDRQHRRGGRDREPSEFTETTLSVDRVTRVVKGGRRMRFRAIVVVGNRKGKVGMGTGKANEVQIAVNKAIKDARRHMIKVPLTKGTIPHEVNVKFKAAKIRIIPASEGTGVIAGGALRVVLDHAGVRNVLSKRFGTGNKLVNAQATFKALAMLKPLRAGDIAEEAAAAAPAVTPEQLKVTEMSKEELLKQQEISRKAGTDA
ncbi:30S ribosomal protein S5, partial [Candidatus Peregrinibacteria bacterium]|nr:30S ribosomal protein S5 [Candidatus Peregrinibacteria bacterium]